MLPNAPYVFTIWSELNDVFMTCCDDNMFSVGPMLRNATSTARPYTAMRCAVGIGCSVGTCTGSQDSHRLSSVVKASTIVSQFSHDRLPLTMSVNWNAI